MGTSFSLFNNESYIPGICYRDTDKFTFSLLKNYPYSELFWSAFFPHFSRIRSKYGEIQSQSPVFNKVPATLLKERPWRRCFPVNFAKFLRTPLFTESLWWLPLNHSWMVYAQIYYGCISCTSLLFNKTPYIDENNWGTACSYS